jgi:hypothetical protein
VVVFREDPAAADLNRQVIERVGGALNFQHRIGGTQTEEPCDRCIGFHRSKLFYRSDDVDLLIRLVDGVERHRAFASHFLALGAETGMLEW